MCREGKGGERKASPENHAPETYHANSNKELAHSECEAGRGAARRGAGWVGRTSTCRTEDLCIMWIFPYT